MDLGPRCEDFNSMKQKVLRIFFTTLGIKVFFYQNTIFYRLTNGSGGSGEKAGSGSGTNNTAVLWMMGTSLNNSSSAAREMDMVLKSEISAHSAYDPATKPGHHGVPVPGKKQVKNSYVG